MSRKKIFKAINKNKLSALYTSLLKNAIEKKEAEYKQEGVVFNVKNDVLRVYGSISPDACKSYLQGLALDIPFEDYRIREEILNFLQLDVACIEGCYNDTDTIIDQYWDGISGVFSALLRSEY